MGGEEAQGGPRVTANQTRRKSLPRTVQPGEEEGRTGRTSPGDLHLPSWMTEQEGMKDQQGNSAPSEPSAQRGGGRRAVKRRLRLSGCSGPGAHPVLECLLQLPPLTGVCASWHGALTT